MKKLCTGLLLMIFSACTTAPQVEKGVEHVDVASHLLEGWNDMVSEIKDSHENIQKLQGKIYRLKLTVPGVWALTLYPEEAFTVLPQKIGAYLEFQVTLHSPKALYASHGGLLKLKNLRADIVSSTEERGELFVNSQTQCLLRVNFLQDQKPVKFKEVAKTHTTRFVISDTSVVKFFGQFEDDVLFSRSPHAPEVPVNVRLELINKQSGERYLGRPVLLPTCQWPKTTEIMSTGVREEWLRPWQCLRIAAHPLKRGLVLSNSCSTPISCEVHQHWGVEQRGQLYGVTHYREKINLAGEGSREWSVSHKWSKELSESEKIYWAYSLYAALDNSFGAKGRPLPQDPALDYRCEWGKE
jgi:hypothetical protein